MENVQKESMVERNSWYIDNNNYQLENFYVICSNLEPLGVDEGVSEEPIKITKIITYDSYNNFLLEENRTNDKKTITRCVCTFT
jgi:hypothetical protein